MTGYVWMFEFSRSKLHWTLKSSLINKERQCFSHSHVSSHLYFGFIIAEDGYGYYKSRLGEHGRSY